MAVAAPVSSSFSVPYETELVLRRDSMLSAGKFTITDEQGSLLFTVTSKGAFIWSAKRTIHDASGKVLILIKRDMRWIGSSPFVAFRGESESESELLFTFKQKSSFPVSSSFVVLLPANNDDSSRPDFLVERNQRGNAYTILFNGRPIAEAKRIDMGMGYRVKVYPGEDRAFITALMICLMLEKLNKGS